MYRLLIDMFVSQETKLVRIIVMTGVGMAKDTMILITGIHDEICIETWKNGVTMETLLTEMDAIRTVELKMVLFAKMKSIEFLLNAIEHEQESHTLTELQVQHLGSLIVLQETLSLMSSIQAQKMAPRFSQMSAKKNVETEDIFTKMAVMTETGITGMDVIDSVTLSLVGSVLEEVEILPRDAQKFAEMGST